MRDLTLLTVGELGAALERGEVSSREVTQAYLDRIAREDGAIGAYLTVTAQEALLAADASDQRRRAGRSLGALDGIPFAIKDNICSVGIPTTCGSRFLERYLPPYDATALLRLKEAGAVLLGKLNMDEFGMGSTTERSAFHPTRNPWDLTRVPGGSSGGAAAAVSARLAPFALGSDTGGSVRQPAAFCGTVGLKPTYGTVSRYGLVAYASSMDQIGPLTRSVSDAATVLGVIGGTDPRDATTRVGTAPDLSAVSGMSVTGLRIGLYLPPEGECAPEISAALTRAAKTYESLGAALSTIELPSPERALSAYYVLSAAEASSNLARFDGIRFGRRAEGCDSVDALILRSRSEGFGDEVKRRILLGTFALSAGYAEQYYERARRTRHALTAELAALFAGCDLILMPTAPSVAFPFGAYDGDPAALYRQDRYTVPASLAGLPALSLPFGRTDAGLPVGIQLIANRGADALLLGAAAALEEKGGVSP